MEKKQMLKWSASLFIDEKLVDQSLWSTERSARECLIGMVAGISAGVYGLKKLPRVIRGSVLKLPISVPYNGEGRR